jgi:hypothetical protein
MATALRYPVYVISKGRWESRYTARALGEIRVPFRIVIEPQEYPQYAAVIDPACILTLPFSDLGKGSIPARNWVWDHATSEGHARHWIMDDNICRFYRFNRNQKVPVSDGAMFRAMEDFADRYVNVPMAGPQYEFFVPRRQGGLPPVRFNTRVYSCILLSNAVPHRWRGRYNEDTDLSLRFLKDGFCTALFNAFLAKKRPTMEQKGGNTDELYRGNGRLEMARSLRRQHPDVVKVTRKWGRWQHQVDYRPFRGNKLVRRPDAALPGGPDEYGMRLVRVAPKGRD